jgi:UDP:flavonoid glycosyltransferase YjiC (YdhE family)
MKIGFIGLPSPGHLNPMSALARQLQSRSHDVVMFSPPSDCLSTLLGEVPDNGVYRENARRLQDIIAKTNGLSMAADIVERSFGVTKKAPLPEEAIHG